MEHPAMPADPAAIASYHAHIYFDAATRPAAERLRGWIGARFAVQLGRWHEKTVGPHAAPMYQVAFDKALFAEFVLWLMLNRLGLTVFVHPNTDDPWADHLVHALWLGAVLPLSAEGLPRSLAARGEAPAPVVPNTAPGG
ncbi:aromatic ring-cleaving dioxygenase [Roseomonas sp. NAR14]|uniref:Aromatic ring-cleaving dioxygenase n=1 Tax=Roseomonas acroporae TaxID=2937791 RepID=A0A9X2BWL7_9PROT|nr:DOPA 4,5-dioxygenase family protein [Roseomonas acroporae]MCK8784020.1 aromatic ring-cleaving dioxygenase [Roseomonas acroporae]